MERKREKVKDIIAADSFNREVTVKGWVRTKRGTKKVAFIALNDGSTIRNIQIVVNIQDFDSELLKKISTGSCICVTGTLVQSLGREQLMELQANEIHVYGNADPAEYPLQKKGHTLEFLRENAHIRPRTNTFGAIFRIRHELAYSIHTFFYKNGFKYLHTPIITGSDCEGAGEMFRVTTLDPKNPPLKNDGSVDFEQDFFGRETNLTVSGQLEGELGALALGEIYTFGPTFRAENSNTPRHLSEFWMVEPEMAFWDNWDNMDLAEDFLQYIINWIYARCYDDLKFLEHMYAEGLIEKLRFITDNTFERISYTEAIEILENAKETFEFPVYWGADLQVEHEKYLVEQYLQKPVIIYDYPKDIKAFYMKQNKDNKTVRAMDVIFPQIGEIIGGSEREEDYNILYKRVKELGLPIQDMWWYLDTRKFGTAPHSGFGLGFERLMVFITGMRNIRDVIPFPRSPNSAEF